MMERKEPFGSTPAAILSGLFVLFIDKLLPWEKFFGELPIIPRILLAVSAGLFVWQTWRYWEILSGAGEARGSPERNDYDALVQELQEGGTPAKVLPLLREALPRYLSLVLPLFFLLAWSPTCWLGCLLQLYAGVSRRAAKTCSYHCSSSRWSRRSWQAYGSSPGFSAGTKW